MPIGCRRGNTKACHYFQDGKARICQDVCPENAIDLARKGSEKTVEVDGIVLATGYVPFDPRQKTRFNFDGYTNMITGLDLERMLRDQGGAFRPSDGKPAQTVAFVQCVGSRDISLGHNYCSRVCCGYALRMGMRIGHDDKNANVSVFYMDIQNFGKDFDRYMKEARGSVRLVRSMPGDYYSAPDDRISVRYYDQEQRAVINEEFDLVVLSVGISPNPENGSLSSMLGLSVNQFGFLAAPESGSDTASGLAVTVAGTAEGPMDVAESITHAARAAEQMARCLGVIQ
jgi:heterodisulfide reductase subunit A